MTGKSVLVRIHGRVQGVWFRGWTKQTAIGLGLNGWVRNRPDGSVQALFSGPDKTVDQMLRACAEGPPLARVSSIQPEATEPPGEEGFHVMPDG